MIHSIKQAAKTLRMAANFKILTDRSEDRIHLRLYGDFDGSSAFELIHLLKKYRPHASKIHIHTQGLNQIHPFGLDIFNKSYGIMNECVNRIAFSGDKAPDFLKPLSYTSL